MEEKIKRDKVGWLGGGVAIALAGITDLIMIGLYFILIGFVLNFVISAMFLFAFSLWLALKRQFTLTRGLVLGQAIFSSLVPFVLTSTVSAMMAKIVAAEKLAAVSPALAGMTGETGKTGSVTPRLKIAPADTTPVGREVNAKSPERTRLAA